MPNDNTPLPDEGGNKMAPRDALEVPRFDLLGGDGNASASGHGPDPLAVALGERQRGGMLPDEWAIKEREKQEPVGAGPEVHWECDENGRETGCGAWDPSKLDHEMIASALRKKRMMGDSEYFVRDAQGRDAVAGAVHGVGELAALRNVVEQHEGVETAERLDGFRARAQALEDADPSFYFGVIDAIADPDLPISESMAKFITSDEAGAAVGYHLAAYPDIAAEIASLPAEEATQRMTALASSKLLPGLSAQRQAQPQQQQQPARKFTQAPEPISTVKGGGGGWPRDPKDMGMEEYIQGRTSGRIR